METEPEIRPIILTYRRMPDELIAEWEQWFDRHGIEAKNIIASDGFIERDVSAKQVRYLGFKLDGDGKIVIDVNEDYVRETKVVQLDFEPEPFPKDGP